MSWVPTKEKLPINCGDPDRIVLVKTTAGYTCLWRASSVDITNPAWMEIPEYVEPKPKRRRRWVVELGGEKRFAYCDKNLQIDDRNQFETLEVLPGDVDPDEVIVVRDAAYEVLFRIRESARTIVQSETITTDCVDKIDRIENMANEAITLLMELSSR